MNEPMEGGASRAAHPGLLQILYKMPVRIAGSGVFC